MKKFFLLSTAIALTVFFVACEEEAIPLPLPQLLPAEQTEEASSEPPPQEASGGSPAATALTPVVATPIPMNNVNSVKSTGSADQSSSGKYTIQIAVFPSETSAKALVKKMSANGIKAYYARVSAPDPKRGLCSIYFRVRIGFFDEISEAENFAKSELEPLGYDWWVDRRYRDTLGDPDPSALCGSVATPKAQAQAPAPVVKTTVAESEVEAAKREYKEIVAKNKNTATTAVESEVEAAKREYKEIVAKNTAKGAGLLAPPPPPPPRK